MGVVDKLDVYIDLLPGIEDAAPGKGQIPAEYMLIGQCPSPSRPAERKNEPFGSKSYNLVQKIIEGRSVYVTNLVKEPWPSSRKLPVKLIRFYYPYLLEEIRIVRPKRILALGSEAAKVLCPGFDELREDHGTLFLNPEVLCYVMPTYHFSAVARQPLLRKLLARDLERFFTVPNPVRPEYKLIRKWPDRFPQGADVFMDLEWAHDEDNRITKVGFSVDRSRGVFIKPDPTPAELRELRDKLREAKVTLIGHNYISDLTQLNRMTGKPWMFRVRDTMVRAHVDGEEFMSLKHLTTYYTDRPGSRAMGGTEDDAYNAEDVLSTRAVEDVLREQRGDPYILDVLFDLVPWIARMQTNGVYIDRKKLKKLLHKQEDLVVKTLDALLKIADINWDAPAQVGEALVASGVKLVERTAKTGQYSTSEKVLAPIAQHYPQIQALLAWQEATKYLEFYSSWMEKSSDDHPYLHPQLKMLGTRTGRFSMAEPNLQQVPRVGPAKTIFRSRHPGGTIGLMDLSQAELRVVALLANDREMVKALLGGDFHADVAASIYGLPIDKVSEAQRKKSKGVTFGILYGGSDTGLSYNTGAPVKEVRKIKQGLMARFKGLKRWIDEEEQRGLEAKYSETILGRRRSLLELIYAEGEDSAKRKIINTPVQATASDIILIILRKALKEVVRRGLRTRCLFGIHDASIWDIYPDEQEDLVECLKVGMRDVAKSPLGALPLYKRLPFVGDLIIGETWAHCEKTNEAFAPLAKYELSTHS